MNGVVHVGAHRFEEASKYISDGRLPIICFEPQELTEPHDGRVTWAPFALGSTSGLLDMRIPHHLHETDELDTQSASGLALIKERAIAIGWTPTECEHLCVEMIRFDEWAKGLGFYFDWNNNPCSLLVIDVQGMELQVMEGFGPYLDGFEEIIVECSAPPLYEGGASAHDVSAFLSGKKFIQFSPFVRHGDVRFIKEENQYASRNHLPDQ